MIDWLGPLMPIWLALLVVLLVFLGCEPARLGGPPRDPQVSMILSFPFPDEVDVAWADFRWTVSVDERGPVSVPGTPIDGVTTFEHIETPPEAGRWVVWCAFFTRSGASPSTSWGEEVCGPFLVEDSDIVAVRFRVEHRSGPGTFRVVRDLCPGG
jgi:hypothetical protein